MPDLSWNKSQWDSDYDWTGRGEEWSQAWGSSEAQWFGSLYPRLHRFLPVQNLLEIAPGFGRWTRYLLDYVQGDLVGVDLSQECVESCRQRFADRENVEFLTNDGLSLDAVEDGRFGMVFSFDSLVHADLDVHQGYVPQLLNKLDRNGVAFIHHSNWAGAGAEPPNTHYRGEDVSAAAYAEIVTQAGGHVLVQECVNWGSVAMIDTMTLFCRGDRERLPATVRIENPQFMAEAAHIRDVHHTYTKVR